MKVSEGGLRWSGGGRGGRGGSQVGPDERITETTPQGRVQGGGGTEGGGCKSN